MKQAPVKSLAAIFAPAIAALGLGSAASAAMAPEDRPSIIVEGSLERQDQQLLETSRAISRRTRIDKPVARYFDPVCLGVFGIAPNYAGSIIRRMEEVARALDIPLANENCTVNTLVGFVKDGRAQVERMRKEEPKYFKNLLEFEFERIVAGTGAVHAWHATESRGVDGLPLGATDFGATQVSVNRAPAASRLELPIRMDMVGSVVLIETSHLSGKTPRQIADYAAMRSFASVDDLPTGARDPIPTILSLFSAAGDAPSELTDFDWAYLSATYQLPPGADESAVHAAARRAFKDRVATQ